MKRILCGFCGLILAGVIGCNGSGTPGGPGATGANTGKAVVGTEENTFTLETPALSTSMKQGEAKQVAVSIKRGKNFNEDVILKVSELPKGVTMEPVIPTIKAGEQEAKLTFKATDAAALGDHVIKVTGQPTKGAAAANDIKLTVTAK